MSDRPQQFVYDGPEGQTRRQPVHVPFAEVGGGVRTVRVYRVVNVATDPQLRAPALDGTLNTVDGVNVALPFVFHDPTSHRFVLVVPEALSHRLLRERARLLERLADDTEHRLPPYVASCDAVVGVEALAEYLDAPDAERASALKKKERQLDEREKRLTMRAETITAKEDDLRLMRERLEVTRRELELRERELDGRFDALREREEAFASGEMDVVASEAPIPSEDTSEVIMSGGTVVEDLASAVQLVEDELSEDTGVRNVDGLDIEELDESDAELVEAGFDEVDEDEFVEELGDEVEAELLDEDAIDASDLVSSVEEAMDDGYESEMPTGSEAPPALSQRLPAPATPPKIFFEDRQLQMVAAMADGVWLFARLQEGHEKAFRGEPDLLVQYLTVDDYPVVLLTLVDWSEPRPIVRRAGLDPKDAEDRALLDALAAEMKATTALFSPEGRFERTIEITAAERAQNLRTVLERADAATGDVDPAVALERALAAPPPVRLKGHPFDDDAPAETAKEAFSKVAALAKWTAPAKRDLALLGLSIPEAKVRATCARIVGDAKRFGLALTEPVLSYAVEIGVAEDAGTLVGELLEAFVETANGETGLGKEVVARNWEQLLALADEYELSLEEAVHEAAQKHIGEVRGGSTPPPVDASKLEELEPDALVPLLDHPKLRTKVAHALLERGDPSLLSAVAKAIRKMPREEVLETVPRLIAFGEAAADALLDLLQARKTFVRQAAVLALGELQLRRSISPLVGLLQSEPSEVWMEVGRILAGFGGGGVRTLTRAMKTPKGAESRFAYTLAHLMSGSAAEQVEKLQADENASVKAIALEAMTQRQVAESHAKRVSNGGADAEDEPVLAFSVRFRESLEALRDEEARA